MSRHWIDDRAMRYWLVERDDLYYVVPASRDGSIRPLVGPWAVREEAIRAACTRYGRCVPVPKPVHLAIVTAASGAALLLLIVVGLVLR